LIHLPVSGVQTQTALAALAYAKSTTATANALFNSRLPSIIAPLFAAEILEDKRRFRQQEPQCERQHNAYGGEKPRYTNGPRKIHCHARYQEQRHLEHVPPQKTAQPMASDRNAWHHPRPGVAPTSATNAVTFMATNPAGMLFALP